MFDDDDVVVSTPAGAGLSAAAEPGTGTGEAAGEEVSVSRAADAADSAPSTSGALGPVRAVPQAQASLTQAAELDSCVSVARRPGRLQVCS